MYINKYLCLLNKIDIILFYKQNNITLWIYNLM